MQVFILVPLIVALATVLQAGLNKSIVESWGLPATVLLNAAVFAVASVLFYVITRRFADYTPEIFANVKPVQQFSTWYLLPGLCGFIIVLGLPIGLKALGALKLFTILVGLQILFGLLWDMFVDGGTVNVLRIAGAVITLAGVALSIAAR